jgi:carbonic anhydrase
LAHLKDFNERFSRGVKIPHDDFADVRRLAHGQYPAAAFVDCIDSRVHVDVVFNLGLGMAFSANVAGNVVNPDILGSIEYGAKVAGSKVVVVLGHTKCGAIKGACDGVKLGNLTQLLAKIQPAIDAVPDDGTPRNSKNDAFTTKVAIANVKLQLQRLRDESPVLREMEEQGKILIVGALYDVETGLATWLEE